MLSVFKKIKERKATAQLKEKQSVEAVEEVELKLCMMKEHLTVHMIEVERICPSPLQREEEPEAELRGLCDSIRRNGLLQPLTVRRVSKDCSSFGGIFTLISGARRLEALKMLGIAKVPCIICDLPASAVLAAAASARIHQKSTTPFENAGYLAQVRDEHCLNTESAAARLSLDGDWAKKLDKLRAFKEDEWKLAVSAELSTETLARIADIPDEGERRRALAAAVSSVCGVSARERPAPAPKRRMLFNDLTPLCNSVERMVNGIRKAGVAAEWRKEDLGDFYEVRIRVPKKSYQIVSDRSESPKSAKTPVEETRRETKTVSAAVKESP